MSKPIWPFEDEYSDSWKDHSDRPSRPSNPLGRNHRCRAFRVKTGHVHEVWDTLEMPFEAPDFPRGELLFQSVSVDPEIVAQQSTAQRRELRAAEWYYNLEVLQAPAEIWRCRLYRVPLEKPVFETVRYVEVWDSLAEPCEYRYEMPVGELLATAADFSRVHVWEEIEKEKKQRGIISAGTWKMASHT